MTWVSGGILSFARVTTEVYIYIGIYTYIFVYIAILHGLAFRVHGCRRTSQGDESRDYIVATPAD